MEEIDIIERSHTSAVEWSRILKQDIVKEDGVGTDIAPTVLVLSNGHPITMIARARNIGAAFTLVAGISAMRPAAVTVLWESYQRRGGDTSVAETITVVTSALHQDAMLTVLPYKYAGKDIVWLEPTIARAPAQVTVDGDELGGVLHDQFRAALRATEDAPDDIRSHLDEMEASGLDGWMNMSRMLCEAMGEDIKISIMAQVAPEDLIPGYEPPSTN